MLKVLIWDNQIHVCLEARKCMIETAWIHIDENATVDDLYNLVLFATLNYHLLATRNVFFIHYMKILLQSDKLFKCWDLINILN